MGLFGLFLGFAGLIGAACCFFYQEPVWGTINLFIAVFNIIEGLSAL